MSLPHLEQLYMPELEIPSELLEDVFGLVEGR